MGERCGGDDAIELPNTTRSRPCNTCIKRFEYSTNFEVMDPIGHLLSKKVQYAATLQCDA